MHTPSQVEAALKPQPMSWVAEQVLRHTLAAEHARTAKPPNPNPPGQPRDGSTSSAVMIWLLQRPSANAWWSLTQVIRGTGRDARNCSWAVLFLARCGYIDRERDVANSRYLRYRASAKARETFGGK